MNKSIVLALSSLVAVLTVGLSSVGKTEAVAKSQANYVKFVQALREAKEIGDCAVSVSSSGDPSTPESFHVNILTSDSEHPMRGFALDSPMMTQGTSKVVFSKKLKQAIYSASDLAGWTNLAVYFDSKQKAVGLKMYMSLPSGEIYNTGTVCGVTP